MFFNTTNLMQADCKQEQVSCLPGVNHQTEIHARHDNTRSGFTLIELLVVIGILLIVASLTLAMVNINANAERVRGASRNLQSYIAGARDRAIYEANRDRDSNQRKAIGVRLLQDPSGTPGIITSMVYINTQPLYPGVVSINPTNKQIITAYPAQWDNFGSDQLGSSPRLKIPNDANGVWYTLVKTQIGMTSGWMLAQPKSDIDPMTSSTFSNLTSALELLPTVMENQEPRVLGNGAVIDLRYSEIPAAWRTGTNSYSHQMDILFSPRGTVIGSTASVGVINLLVTDVADALKPSPACASFWQASLGYPVNSFVAPNPRTGFIFRCTTAGVSGTMAPAWTTTVGSTVTDNGITWECVEAKDGCSTATRERLIFSIATQTGKTSSSPVYISGTTENADPFKFAETGEVAVK